MLGWKVEGRRPTSCSHQPYWCAFFSVTNKNLATTQTGRLVINNAGKRSGVEKNTKVTLRYPNKGPTFSPLLLVLRKETFRCQDIFWVWDFAVHTTGKETPPSPLFPPPPSSRKQGFGPDRANDFGWRGGKRSSYFIFHIRTHTQRKKRKTKLLTVPNPTTGEICWKPKRIKKNEKSLTFLFFSL